VCVVYLNAIVKGSRRSHSKTLLTLHNRGYQGIFPDAQFSRTSLNPSVFAANGLEFYGSVNCLKGGRMFSDIVSMVSKTYAKEILTAEFSCELERVLASRLDTVQDIPNKIDSATCN